MIIQIPDSSLILIYGERERERRVKKEKESERKIKKRKKNER
jgi:hypothetical protein